MASITMTSTILGASTLSAGKIATNGGRRFAVVKASGASADSQTTIKVVAKEQGSNNGRRDLMFAATAAALCAVAKVAMADEPKRGSAEAKKKYGPICVTMPTARICHN